MHPFAFIFLVAAIVSAALSSAIVAGQPSARRTRVLGGIFACISAWALLDLFATQAATREDAVTALRLVPLSFFWLGPLSIHLLVDLQPDLEARYRPLLRASYVSAALLCVAVTATPWFIADARQISWGWTPVYAPGVLFALLLNTSLPGIGFTLFLRDRVRPEEAAGQADSRVQGLALIVPICVVLFTEYVWPNIDPNGPRLGTLMISIIGAMLWGYSARAGHGIPAEGTLAREVLEWMTDGVAIVSRDGRFRAMNRNLARLANMDASRCGLSNVREFFPDDCDLLGSEIDSFETLLTSEDGVPIPVSVSTGVLFDRTGSEVGRVVVVKDQRRVVELRRRLVTSGRLAVTGELAAGIAHEVNNPIAFVQANLNLLRCHLDELERDFEKNGLTDVLGAELTEGRRSIDESLDDVGRVISIVREVRDFAHSGTSDSAPQDVNALMASAVNLATLHLPDRSAIQERYGSIPPIECSGQDLRQVFLNLLLHVTQVTQDVCGLQISTSLQGDVVRISIEDRDWHIDPQLIGRSFDPLLESQSASGASGLSLSLAYQIVRQMKGRLTVDPLPGGGTQLCVDLPVSDAELEPAGGSAS